MIFSVMNRATRLYDYYETSEPDPWHAPAAPAARYSSPLGSVPEDAAWPLPSGARKVGSGDTAKGRMAVIARGGAALGDLEPATVVLGIAAFMALGGLALLAKGAR